jgi:hypothetical protein
MTSSSAMGAVQVGMVGCPLTTTYGLVRFWRMASMPSRRKPQMLRLSVLRHSQPISSRNVLT